MRTPGIGPGLTAWKAVMLPLQHVRKRPNRESNPDPGGESALS
jgi:hypothetical protein